VRQEHDERRKITVTVEPGICGFPCDVEVTNRGRKSVTIHIKGSDCEIIQRLSNQIKTLSLRELFAPIDRNPVFISSRRAGCHPPCPVPVAILKAAEVALDMALPRDVVITFQSQSRKSSNGKQ
jgi:hypothetical protein